MNTRMTGRLIGAAGAAALGVVAGLSLGRARRAVARASMALAGDWEGQLKAEHKAIKKMLQAMGEVGVDEGPRRVALVNSLADLMTRHTLEEENVIYPALRACGLTGGVKILLDDHADMRSMLRELEAMSPESPQWADTARRLKAIVEHHIDQEELELFPALHDTTIDGENDRLTQLVRREGLKLS